MRMSLQVRGQISQLCGHVCRKERGRITRQHCQCRLEPVTCKVMGHYEVEDAVGHKLGLLPCNAFQVESLQLGLALVELPTVALHTTVTASNTVRAHTCA